MIKPNFYTQKVEETSTYGKFVIEPFSLSFGQSVGHALRRTLLSSLEGSAVTNVKIDGVAHLFSTLKGIKESVLELVLNLKQLRFETSGAGPFKMTLKVKGIGKIYGKDVEGEVKVVNTDLYICEITDDKAKLDIEMIVEVGVGYSQVSDREDKQFGFIPVDAFFSPVKKANIKVEEARVGRKSNKERLVIEIWTDGSIKPDEALRQSSLILSEHFSHILSGKDVRVKEDVLSAEEAGDKIDKKLYEVIIDELSLPSRVINALLREHIETVADLVKVGKEKLTNMKGVGKKSIELIEEELKKMGIELK